MRFPALLAAAVVAVPLSAPAQDSAARSLAATCAACHGPNGRSVTTEVTSLVAATSGHPVAPRGGIVLTDDYAPVDNMLAPLFTARFVDEQEE